MPRSRLQNATAIAATAFIAQSAWAMDFSSLPVPDGQTPVLLLEGEIVPGDAERFLNFLGQSGMDDSSARLILNSPGGNVNEADKIARAIRGRGLPVTVLDGQMCASACFLLFAAALERSASPGAMIGVHSVSLFGDENLLTVGITTLLAREAAEFGVPSDVIGKMVTTQPSDMAWLTEEELKEMNVHGLAATPSVDSPSQSAPTHVAAEAPQRGETQTLAVAIPHDSVPLQTVEGKPMALVYRPADFVAKPDATNAPSSYRPRLITPNGASSPLKANVPDYVATGARIGGFLAYLPGS